MRPRDNRLWDAKVAVRDSVGTVSWFKRSPPVLSWSTAKSHIFKLDALNIGEPSFLSHV